MERDVQESLHGRTGGAVTLAVGMARIFSNAIPGMNWLIKYWYHFAIMFEAPFILTTIDAGTRIARFLVQEFLGRIWKPLGDLNWLPASLLATGLVVFGWGYFIYTGSVETIWPMFGMANQLLAVIALAVVTTVPRQLGSRPICAASHYCRCCLSPRRHRQPRITRSPANSGTWSRAVRSCPRMVEYRAYRHADSLRSGNRFLGRGPMGFAVATGSSGRCVGDGEPRTGRSFGGLGNSLLAIAFCES